MEQADFRIADSQIERLHDYTVGHITTIKLVQASCEKYLEKWHIGAKHYNDQAWTLISDNENILKNMSWLMFQAEETQNQLQEFLQQFQQTTLVGRGIIIQNPLNDQNKIVSFGYEDDSDVQTELGTALVVELLKAGMSQTDILKLVRKLIEMTARNLGKETRNK